MTGARPPHEPALGPGTYRTQDGALIRCFRGQDGGLETECEDDFGVRLLIAQHRPYGAVKLSDAPTWPDGIRFLRVGRRSEIRSGSAAGAPSAP